MEVLTNVIAMHDELCMMKVILKSCSSLSEFSKGYTHGLFEPVLARSYFFSITFCVFLLLGPSTLYLDSLFDFKKFFGTLLAFPHFWTLMRVSFLNILQGRVFVK